MKLRSLVVLVVLAMSLTAAAGGNTLVVTEVREGCTVVFEGGFTVHLTGVALPAPGTELGRQACEFLKLRIEGQRVAVFTWTTDNTAAGIVHGDDGLAFATIKYGNAFSADIAVQLLERGLARVDPEHLPDGSEHYLEIEKAARAAGLGMWAG